MDEETKPATPERRERSDRRTKDDPGFPGPERRAEDRRAGR